VIAASVATTISAYAAGFTRDDYIWIFATKISNDFFRNSITVDISGIYKSTTSFVIQIELIASFVNIGISTPRHSS
jgi:hypothetical protein